MVLKAFDLSNSYLLENSFIGKMVMFLSEPSIQWHDKLILSFKISRYLLFTNYVYLLKSLIFNHRILKKIFKSIEYSQFKLCSQIYQDYHIETGKKN